jgi:hypothetical protein
MIPFLFILIFVQSFCRIKCFSIITESIERKIFHENDDRSIPMDNQRRIFVSSTIGIIFTPNVVHAKTSETSALDEIEMIREASSTLKTLLDNWDKATVDCTYADVPRELLETKNKEQLLEKASTFALFDKSTSIVSCKKTNKIVRDYIGVTGKGPLVNVDKRMMKKNVVSYIDPDDLEDYYNEVENFQGAIARAASSSYTSGVADFDAVNNFEKGDQKNKDDSNLEQARRSIIEAHASISRIVSILDKSAPQ